MNILTRLFGKPEEINGANRCPTYLWRWTVLKLRHGRGIYLHHFVNDDWSLDLHDHPKRLGIIYIIPKVVMYIIPKRFISIGLKGRYFEWTPDSAIVGFGRKAREYRAPWIRSFPANYIHRLTVPEKSCWTLVIVLRAEREWGFWHNSEFIHWRQYVKPGNPIADKMKVCQ
jgi:hypothetical protein